MRVSQYFLATCREISSHVHVVSYQLMLRAGLIRKISSGLYAWLPTGLRVLRKLEDIIRKEMNKIGAIEMILPMVQPGVLWKQSGRWDQYGLELLRFKNRNNQDFVLGPTHEELISKIICKELISYKQMPIILYQIQSKFRDEMRPRFGVIRSCEFIMKDGYSFHVNDESLQDTYKIMYQTYQKIFNLMGINFTVVKADSGNIGGKISHEFHAIANSCENTIISSEQSNCSDNVHLTKTIKISNCSLICNDKKHIMQTMKLITMPNVHTIIDMINKYNLSQKDIVRTLIVRANKNFEFPFVALLIRFDHKLCYAKVERLHQVNVPLVFANEDEIRSIVGVHSSVLGPINLPIPYIVDCDVAIMNNFISGANINNSYFFGVNWGRDLPFPLIADLRQFVSSDNVCSDELDILKVNNSIEIGHIFQLGSRYLNKSKKIVTIQENKKKYSNIKMGCYGIGVTRIVSAIIEQNNDKYGIKWPDQLAPFFVAIIPINMHNFSSVAKVAEDLYGQFTSLGVDTLLDDRNESPGVMFSDIELIGIPHIITISNRGLHSGEVEYKYRRSNIRENIKLNKILDFILTKSSLGK